MLYNLNQLGGALGVAVVALILAASGVGKSSAEVAIGAFRNAYWFLLGVTLVILVATPLLPGRPEHPVPVPAAAPGESAPADT
ncbi:hypothetical protein SAMN05421505_14046 [Sinosporangium album]|uniref:Uncharacterized protein n=1 Tax=Sinosporangium album TaxID=504805 RepID=A0A1G8J1Q9_9ACTN|nr:hypothetical protein SAMN05421505_14046 [Sinosporangium album]